MPEILFNLSIFIPHLILFCVALFLGFVIFLHAGKNITNKIFAYVILSSLGWVVSNFFALSVIDRHQTVVFIKFVMVFASFLTALVLLFAYLFPKKDNDHSYSFWILVVAGILGYATLGYFIWSDGVSSVATTDLPTIQNIVNVGSISLNLVSVWGIITFILNISAAAMLIVKLQRAPKQERDRYKIVLWSMGATFILLPTILFLPVALFENTSFQPYGPLAYLPMFMGVGYAILKHQIFNVKLVFTEILVLVALLILFLNIFV